MNKHVADAYKTHFRMGFHQSKHLTSSFQDYSVKGFTPLTQVKYGSTIYLGNDSVSMKSLSSTQFSFKSLEMPLNKKSVHKNDHTFIFGYRKNTCEPKNITSSNADTAKYINLNKQTNVVLGKDKSEMKSITKTSYVPKKIVVSNEISKDLNKTSSFWKQEKNSFETNSMEFKGQCGEKAVSQKIPDSKIFNQPRAQSAFYSTTGKLSLKEHKGKATQDPLITREFIYNQHFSLGKESILAGNQSQENYHYVKDSESEQKNKKKVLGSNIELGLCNNEYNTVYGKFYPTNEVNPPLPIKNCKSSVCLGIRKDNRKSEYDCQFFTKNAETVEIPYPKNKIQNHNIFKKYY